MARRIWRNVLGIGLLLAGLAGIVLPLVPAIILIPAALLILDWPGKRRAVARLRKRAAFRRGERWLERRWGIRLNPSEPRERSSPPDPP